MANEIVILRQPFARVESFNRALESLLMNPQVYPGLIGSNFAMRNKIGQFTFLNIDYVPEELRIYRVFSKADSKAKKAKKPPKKKKKKEVTEEEQEKLDKAPWT